MTALKLNLLSSVFQSAKPWQGGAVANMRSLDISKEDGKTKAKMRGY